MTTPQNDAGAQGANSVGQGPGYWPQAGSQSGQVPPPGYGQITAGYPHPSPGAYGPDAALTQFRRQLRWAVIGAILAGLIVAADIALVVISASVGALDARTIAWLAVLLLLSAWRLTRYLSKISALRMTTRQARPARP